MLMRLAFVPCALTFATTALAQSAPPAAPADPPEVANIEQLHREAIAARRELADAVLVDGLAGIVAGGALIPLDANDQAWRFAGINTNRQRLWVYVLCSSLASLGGILTFLEDGSVAPESTGETWELYAITGAVLGGCTLRGGEGTVPGMLLGAAVLPLLRNLINRVGNFPEVREIIPAIDPVIPIIIGLTLLAGTVVDELLRRKGTGNA